LAAKLPRCPDADEAEMTQTPRILALDLARSLALLGMVTFHITYDLLLFGIMPGSYAATALFQYHPRLVAGAFLALAGLSLWLSHGQTLRWPAFWRRFTKIVAAAALVTLATRLAMPEFYIFFGILHAMALYSLLGLAFLRLPAILTAACGIAVLLGSYYLSSEVFNAPTLAFLGLAAHLPMTADFEPVFPWFGPFLLGLALGQTGSRFGLWQRLALWPTAPMPTLGALAWPGRHSLAIYLIHQPILMGLIWAYTTLRT
jgi:uncharacterized membrane protein